ncbi:MAG: hypothetical protein LBI02_04175 [Opitutaceae bacterium]|nr:hypothetical protein [Opitutaceae bacterium]
MTTRHKSRHPCDASSFARNETACQTRREDSHRKPARDLGFALDPLPVSEVVS